MACENLATRLMSANCVDSQCRNANSRNPRRSGCRLRRNRTMNQPVSGRIAPNQSHVRCRETYSLAARHFALFSRTVSALTSSCLPGPWTSTPCLAPCSRRCRTISACPPAEAAYSALPNSPPCALTSAPCSGSCRTISTYSYR
jgi:hypothetical protein